MSIHSPDQDDLSSGDRVITDRYKVIRRLSSGGMGQVFLVRELATNALRALKVLRGDVKNPVRAAKRFKREALALSRLRHPNIVDVIDFGVADWGTPYLVMEFVRGRDAEKTVATQGPLPLKEALAVLESLASGLEYAHETGIIHRDMKPSNVLFQPTQPAAAKIIDFGLVRLVTGEQLTRITSTEQLLGTPRFMAPEQCLGRETGAAADVYGLAGIAYFLISGHPVFSCPSVLEAIAAHIDRPPIRLGQCCPTLPIPEALDTLLMRCLRKSPESRPSAAEMRMALGRIRAETRVPSTVSAPRNPPGLAHMSLQSVVNLSSLIWRSPPDAGETIFHQNDDKMHGDALYNQVSTLLCTLARVLLNGSHDTEPLRLRLEAVTTAEETVQAAEIDLALHHSDDTVSARDSAADAPARPSAPARMRREIDQLKQQRRQEYRRLFEIVIGLRRSAADPVSASMFLDLDRLVEQYMRLRSATCVRNAGPG